MDVAQLSIREDSLDYERTSGECATEFTDLDYAMKQFPNCPAENHQYCPAEKFEGDSTRTTQTVTSGFHSEIRDYQSSEDEAPPTPNRATAPNPIRVRGRGGLYRRGRGRIW